MTYQNTQFPIDEAVGPIDINPTPLTRAERMRKVRAAVGEYLSSGLRNLGAAYATFPAL